MIKWFTITLIAVVALITVLLGLGYLLKEHEVATTQLKQQLDQQRDQQKAREQRKLDKFTFINATPPKLNEVSDKKSNPIKQNILLKNLTCTSKKQCVLVDIAFVDLSCTFAINTIGASLLTKVKEDNSLVSKCPNYPENSQLSCQRNLCTYGLINN